MRVFEVDYPATQQDKRARLVKVLGALPSHVAFVAIDFDAESLDKLLEYEYSGECKALFIWEGVTHYHRVSC